MTPAEYRAEADRLAASGQRAKAAGLRAAATRAERALGTDVVDAGPPPIRRTTRPIPARIQSIADGLVIPADADGGLPFACAIVDGAGWRIAWAMDGGRSKLTVDEVEPFGNPRDAALLALAVNGRIYA